MKYALVDVMGIVQNIIEYDPAKNYVPANEFSIMSVEDWINPGDQFNAAKPNPITKSPAEIKLERDNSYKNNLAIKALYQTELIKSPLLTFSDYLDQLEAIVINP